MKKTQGGQKPCLRNPQSQMREINFYIDAYSKGVSDFDCGFEVFNSYLKNHSDKSVIHYVVDSESDKLIAYFAVIASGLLRGDPENLNIIPAIELKMFALDKSYQNIGITSSLLNAVFNAIEYFAREFVGADVILLYSVPVEHVLSLYKTEGFQKVEGLFTAFKDPFTEGCIPMFKFI